MHVCTPWKTNFPHNFYGWLCSTLVLSKLKIHFISLSCTKSHLHVTSHLLLNPSFPWSMSLETTPTPLCRFLPGLINNTGCTFSERSVKQVAHYPPLQSFSSGLSPLNRCGVTGWAGNYHRQKKTDRADWRVAIDWAPRRGEGSEGTSRHCTKHAPSHCLTERHPTVNIVFFSLTSIRFAGIHLKCNILSFYSLGLVGTVVFRLHGA